MLNVQNRFITFVPPPLNSKGLIALLPTGNSPSKLNLSASSQFYKLCRRGREEVGRKLALGGRKGIFPRPTTPIQNSSNPRALEDACIHGPIVTPAGQFPNNSLGGEEMAQPPVPCSGDNYTALAS